MIIETEEQYQKALGALAHMARLSLRYGVEMMVRLIADYEAKQIVKTEY